MQYKNVALVIHPLQSYGGAEYNMGVLADMFNEVTIYTAWYDKDHIKEHFPNLDIKSSFLQYLPFKNKLQQEMIPILPYAYRSMKVSKKHDLVIVIADGFEKRIRIPEGVVSVAYTLTPPRFLWLDSRSTFRGEKLTFKLYDQYLYSPLHSSWEKNDKKSMEKFDHVISISNEVQKRVAKIYDRDSVVIYPPVELDSFKFNRKLENREDWFLYLGRVETYKGVELAIRAAIEGNFRLKIAGTGSQMDKMKRLVNELGGKHLVGFLGFVNEKRKKELYYKCKALLYPVYNEDFGIVPVEANASGAPVIAYRSGGVLETIVEGQTGVFFDEYTAESLLSKMKDIEKMKFSPNKMRIQAMNFSRDSFQNKVKTTLDGISKR